MDYGNHSLEVKYMGNRIDSSQYNPVSYNASFIFSYVKVTAYSEGEIMIDCEEEMSGKLYLDGDLIYEGNIDGDTKVYSENLYPGYVPNYTLITSGKGKYKALTITDALHYNVSPHIEVPRIMGQGEDRYIKVELPPDADGNLKVYINGIEVNTTFENGKSSIPLNKLDIGEYNVHIVYDSDSKYESCDEDYYHVKVTRNPNFKITLPSICYAAGSAITFTGSDEIEGTFTISADDYREYFMGSFKNGIAKINVHYYKTGPVTYHYSFKGTYNGEDFEYGGEFNITLVDFAVSLPKIVYEKQAFKVTLTGPQSLNGEIYSSESDDAFIRMKNGKVTFTIHGLEPGVNKINYSFYHEGDYSDGYESSFDVNITPVDFTVSVPKTVYEGKSFKVTLTCSQGLTGAISSSKIYEYEVNMMKGVATLTVNGLKAGVNKIDYSFYYDESRDDCLESSFKVTVVKLPSIKANDFKMDYTSKSKYMVRILNNEGKSIGEGKTVTFYLYADGKKVATKTAKTDKNGYAKVNFNVAPNTYKIKIKYGSIKVTKKYTVNSIIKVNNIQKYNRIISGVSQWVTAKKFEFGLSLKKVDGKFFKGKKVKMTFYRQDSKGKIKDDYWGRLAKLKSVTLKTNSKGACKITYKNLPFKVSQDELHGLIIAVKISYLNDKQWASLNVHSLSPISYYFIA